MYRQTAAQFQADRDIAKARAGYTKVLELDPGFTRASEQLFLLAAREKQWGEAASLAEKITRDASDKGDRKQFAERLKSVKAMQQYGSPRAELCEGPDVTAPTPKEMRHPEYTSIALRTRLQGYTHLWLEIDERGNTRNIKILKRLGAGLDESAVDALRRSKFNPGMRNGAPVTCGSVLEMGFSLP